jgi:hypothetical protein
VAHAFGAAGHNRVNVAIVMLMVALLHMLVHDGGHLLLRVGIWLHMLLMVLHLVSNTLQ